MPLSVRGTSVASATRGRPVDALAGDAGVGAGGDFVRDTSVDDNLEIVNLNVTSAVHLTPARGAEGHRCQRDHADAGPTETSFFDRAGMQDTKVAES